VSYSQEFDYEYFKRPHLPGGIILGLFLIYLGVAFTLENLNLIYIEDALLYCPCFLIVLGLLRFWNRGVLNFWGHVFLLCGVLLQAAFLLDFYVIQIWWPALMIWLGIIVVFKAFLPGKKHPNVCSLSSYERHWQHCDDIPMSSIIVDREK